ncbi:Peroxisomal membrane 22 kDa family protein isoform 2 [Theobroma cacao]|uniref:Peroxisomal membrane 22 kDa family protein isoform 2 n=1 Tax=Theobroma cacao TaxID=3641 RepID=A0A061E1B6_THECC|nr:Peroxisomal membrane 22 kDa family protein isoform 2 [Theobroma cacao]
MSGALRKNSSIIRLLPKQPFTDFTDPINRIHPFLRNQTHTQTREYFRFPNVLRKVKEYEISPSLFASSFSSSSSSSTRVGLVGWYLGMVKSWPVLTKSVTSSLIYIAADFSSQTISKLSSEPYDLVRTSRMAGYGMLILGPSLHFWFNLMSKLFPKRDLITTFKKMAMGQLLYGPAMTVVFFSLNACLQGERSGEIVGMLSLRPLSLSLFLHSVVLFFAHSSSSGCGLTFNLEIFSWCYSFWQPLVSNSFSYLWTVYMTYMASLAKPATIAC